VYLENSERAIPVATSPDAPPETDMPPTRHLIDEAWELGRPVLIVRIGQRILSPEEMAKQSLAGTILLPGEQSLSPALKPPTLPPFTCPLEEPYPGSPYEDCLRNGKLNPNRGGEGPIWPAERVWIPGLDNEGKLQGLRPEDTVAEFTDSSGRRSLVCSN